MTSHDVTIAGYVVVALGAVGLEVAARSHRFDVQTLGTALSRGDAQPGRPDRHGRGWAWVGMHFFAR